MPEADAKEKQGRNTGTLELSEETRDHLAELRVLSEKAEAATGTPARSCA